MIDSKNNEDLEGRIQLYLEHPLAPSLVRGAFFGAEASFLPYLKKEEFELFGNDDFPLVLDIRYLPTAENISSVHEAFGDSCAKLLTAWRALYDRVPGGLDYLRYYFGNNLERDNAIETLQTMSEGTSTKTTAVRISNESVRAQYKNVKCRTPAQHILEDAAIAVSMVEEGLKPLFMTWTKGERTHNGIAFTERTGVQLKQTGCTLLERREIDELLRVENRNRGINPYWKLRSFLKHCGRKMQEANGLQHLCFILYDMALQGREKAFIRHCAPKNGTWIVDLRSVDSPVAALQEIVRVFGMQTFPSIRNDGEGFNQSPWGHLGSYLVQEFAPFEIEHRFFIVDGRIAASTPSDRTLSVLDARTGVQRIDPRVAVLREPADTPGSYDRGETYSRIDRTAVAAMTRKVRAFLQDAYSDPKAASVLPRGFVIDAGIGPNGCGLIEMNSFLNAGIYALDYRKVAKALAAALPPGKMASETSLAA
jgi:hypothetical protein